MKYHTEKIHPDFDTSLRANEKPVKPVGDAKTEDVDNREDLRVALKPPGTVDTRVTRSERDSGRKH